MNECIPATLERIYKNLGFSGLDDWAAFWTEVNKATGTYCAWPTVGARADWAQKETAFRRSLIDRAMYHNEKIDVRKIYEGPSPPTAMQATSNAK